MKILSAVEGGSERFFERRKPDVFFRHESVKIAWLIVCYTIIIEYR